MSSLYEQNCAPAQATEKAEALVPARMSELGRSLESLHKTIEVLEGRLATVLEPRPPQAGQTVSPVPTPPAEKVHQKIALARLLVNSAEATLNSILSRLTV
jgi:hypothetical protein